MRKRKSHSVISIRNYKTTKTEFTIVFFNDKDIITQHLFGNFLIVLFIFSTVSLNQQTNLFLLKHFWSKFFLYKKDGKTLFIHIKIHTCINSISNTEILSSNLFWQFFRVFCLMLKLRHFWLRLWYLGSSRTHVHVYMYLHCKTLQWLRATVQKDTL